MAKKPPDPIPRQVAELPHDKTPKTANIVAAEKIIADISSGIYRSPAAALKELVSNAYDADATKVTITTDAPYFRNLVIEDNGIGMSIETFLQVITHVGGSRKRIQYELSPKYKRKLIGRIGIGLMSVAQLGNLFYVTSSVAGSPTRFIAEVNLEPFHRDDAALRSMGKLKDDGTVQIGAVKYVDNIPEMEDVQYTVITVPNAKKGLISEMTSQVRKAVGAHERLSIEDEGRQIQKFDELIDVVRNTKRADLALDGYYYMLWELGLLCPVNYSLKGPFDLSGRPKGGRSIENVELFKKPKISNFHVFVDGLELKRPQTFPNAGAMDYPSPNPKLYLLDFDRPIADRQLRFTGYVYSQQPRIDPEELKGVQIRIRNVGIGKYDKSWLGYPFEEGLKFGQVTGELYVEDGLEPALNIDRDSFRETDVHYQALRAHVWQLLRQQVFPDFKARQKEYKDKRKKKERGKLTERFQEALSQLPAPLTEHVEITKPDPSESKSFFTVTSTKLLINKDKWRVLADEMQLSNDDAKERFFKVLTVLASNEMLQELTEDELENLLRALAVAVQ
ncbi:MAG TPA: ATP-binding protein [Pyrinomonadaceae bacterium]|nr:ATP-binding protein [Pyrinomonadaceae bacterium]